MTVEPLTSFDTIARRVLYGLKFMYSEFAPVESAVKFRLDFLSVRRHYCKYEYNNRTYREVRRYVCWQG